MSAFVAGAAIWSMYVHFVSGDDETSYAGSSHTSFNNSFLTRQQYCSKECQIAHWQFHKTTCKSKIMKGTWEPEWYREKRTPAFQFESTLLVEGQAKKYMWGNMPALDVLRVQDNETAALAMNQDFNFLFAASGDPRNAIKTIVGLPDSYAGRCVTVLNDREFIIVARHAIMFLIALKFQPKTAVPMIIHLWYSALLPSSMMEAIHAFIFPLIDEVCGRIKDEDSSSLQVETFEINGKTIRIELKKDDWNRLAELCRISTQLTAVAAQRNRRNVMLDPEEIDFRERVMLSWSYGVREGETHFRESGIFLPFGCSTKPFDTPNPTLFPSNEWCVNHDISPRESWLHSEYISHARSATADEIGAIFFYLRDLLLKFCSRLQSSNISFQLMNVDAEAIGPCVEGMKFDRIEISNICDTGFLGPKSCIETFSNLLKPRSQNPRATLLLLFMNAAMETEMGANPDGDRAEDQYAYERLRTYYPRDPAVAVLVFCGDKYHPDEIFRQSCIDTFKPWYRYFDMFMEREGLTRLIKQCGLAIKKEPTIVQPWPYKVRDNAEKEEFEILKASGTVGCERYMELVRSEDAI